MVMTWGWFMTFLFSKLRLTWGKRSSIQGWGRPIETYGDLGIPYFKKPEGKSQLHHHKSQWNHHNHFYQRDPKGIYLIPKPSLPGAPSLLEECFNLVVGYADEWRRPVTRWGCQAIWRCEHGSLSSKKLWLIPEVNPYIHILYTYMRTHTHIYKITLCCFPILIQ
jgi:hypothetical protein